MPHKYNSHISAIVVLKLFASEVASYQRASCPIRDTHAFSTYMHIKFGGQIPLSVTTHLRTQLYEASSHKAYHKVSLPIHPMAMSRSSLLPHSVVTRPRPVNLCDIVEWWHLCVYTILEAFKRNAQRLEDNLLCHSCALRLLEAP